MDEGRKNGDWLVVTALVSRWALLGRSRQNTKQKCVGSIQRNGKRPRLGLRHE
jgi:hypothetical protein